MTARFGLLFFSVIIASAIFGSHGFAHDIHCLSKEQAQFVEPREHWRGVGISASEEGALVRLSVSSEGIWMFTLSPPKMNGAVCVVLLGENWEWMQPRGQEVQRRRDDS